MMVEIKAQIKLYQGDKKRKTPFSSGYRPSFDFIDDMRTTGKITLIDSDLFYPGEKGEVIIHFINRDYLGDDFREGKKFNFYEGKEPLGEGVIREIIVLGSVPNET